MEPTSAFTKEKRESFAKVCTNTRAGFGEIVDLIIIHNEKPVSGNQPRRTLNPLIANLSVVTWERLVADLESLAERDSASPIVPGKAHSRGHASLSRYKTSEYSTDESTLAKCSNGQLPGDWRIRIATSGSGKSLRFGQPENGLTDELVNLVSFWIKVRNSVSHQAFPQLQNWKVQTDASDGKTINTTTARMAFTLFLQLADQTIQAVCRTAGFENPEELWLPQDWLSGTVSPGRGVTDPDERVLWRGRSLALPS